jgi:hypothetical protein
VARVHSQHLIGEPVSLAHDATIDLVAPRRTS